MMASNSSPQNDVSSDSSGDDSAIAFSAVDFSGVDFDAAEEDDDDDEKGDSPSTALLALTWERRFVFGESTFASDDDGVLVSSLLDRLVDLGGYLTTGNYAGALRDSDAAREFFDDVPSRGGQSVRDKIRQRVLEQGRDSVISCIELELLGVAALNLFLQGNYTGPSLEGDDEAKALDGVNPHACFSHLESRESTVVEDSEEKKESLTAPKRETTYQNAVLSELAVDGVWPCQICDAPYFLLLARSILSTLADPSRPDWTCSHGLQQEEGKYETSSQPPTSSFVENAARLRAVHLWNARAVVAHERLLQAREPSITLWEEVRASFQKSTEVFCPSGEASESNAHAATVMLERGLAEHHFDRPGKGKKSFQKAQRYSGLDVEVTGAEGKRTKFQKKATAQMLVRAKSAAKSESAKKQVADEKQKDLVRGQMIEHSEEGILLEKIKFEEENENEVHDLSILDQSILLALCLDVKNSNPADGLTGEEMGAFLARVLDHHDDWMVYSTALLERAWLEFERSHARERSILQMQALADQHTNRLTITQSTRKSVEESAPVQERLRHLHSIVYPPRWLMIQDLADRYAALGIVTSAAELYASIEFWDEVVVCYRRAGKASQAEKIVRERLAVEETPRMWSALGDLTKEPKHYEKAIELSNGRFSGAFLALGEYYFDKGELETAAENYEKALKVRPLAPRAWFRLGTISMRLGRWQQALRAFTEVVVQDPEEADAWANVAAVHMHNRQPAEAYPALVESLKHNRDNWRVWVSKLYTCLDLRKYDEAIQACSVLLDLRTNRSASDGIPPLEEKCVRAIVGGALQAFRESRDDKAALDSTQRTLTRVDELLQRINSLSSNDEYAWIYETMAFFQERTGRSPGKVLENLMKEYRSIQTNIGWEKDGDLVRKLCGIVTQIVRIHEKSEGDAVKQGLIKARFLVRGVVQKLRAAWPDELPEEVGVLENLLSGIDANLKQL